jgi:hypothetical protein
MKKLYCVLSFSKEGYFRGFASGFNKTETKKILFEEGSEGKICFFITDKDFFHKMPNKYIENYYWKISKNSNDLTDLISIFL